MTKATERNAPYSMFKHLQISPNKKIPPMNEMMMPTVGELRNRPRFNTISSADASLIERTFKEVLVEEDDLLQSVIIPGHITLEYRQAYRKIFSPRLTLNLESLDEGTEGTMMRGMYSPDPGIWTLFMFLYTAFGFGLFVVLIVGSSYYSLDKDTDILWLSVVFSIGLLAVYGTAKFGQFLAKDQTRYLEYIVKQVMKKLP
jgi:hypothetical protein